MMPWWFWVFPAGILLLGVGMPLWSRLLRGRRHD